MNRCRTRPSGPSGETLFRALALVLALMVISQILPVKLASSALSPSGEVQKPLLALEPVQVCDGAPDFAGFLADHPWVSASGIAPLLSGTGIAHVPLPEPGFPEGVPSSVYRPPRSVLS
jgi:hypothetical protein